MTHLKTGRLDPMMIVSRSFESRTEVLTPSEDKEGVEASEIQDVLIEPGVYRFAETTFDLTRPGVYRFQPAGALGRQFAVLPGTVSGVASIAAELGALGNSDRNKPWPVQSRIATHRRLLMHCVQFSNLSVFLASKAGLSGRTWLMWNYASLAAGDSLASHAISEISTKDGRERRLFDLSLGLELIVKPGSTDFQSFQAAVLIGTPVEFRRLSPCFGFEYGSRFFNPHSEDFDHDLLAGSKQALLEAYRRIASGGYVIGQDLAGGTFVTEATRALTAALPEDAIPVAKRAEMEQATVLSSPKEALVGRSFEANAFRLNTLIGYRITEAGLVPLPVAEGGDPVALSDRDDAGLHLSSGAVWSVEGNALSLKEEGAYRFRRADGGTALQGIVAQRDAFRFAVNILEAVAHGTAQDGMTPDDLRLVARTAKAVAQGDTVWELLRSLFALVRIPYRLWRVPTDLCEKEADWPIPVWLKLLEIADAEGRFHLVDIDRGVELRVDPVGDGFPAFETAVLEGHPVSVRDICHTPRFSFGGVDGKTGIGTDVMAPVWLADPAFAQDLWAASLVRYPALAETADTRRGTTAASQLRGKAMMKSPGPLHAFAVDVLDAEVFER